MIMRTAHWAASVRRLRADRSGLRFNNMIYLQAVNNKFTNKEVQVDPDGGVFTDSSFCGAQRSFWARLRCSVDLWSQAFRDFGFTVRNIISVELFAHRTFSPVLLLTGFIPKHRTDFWQNQRLQIGMFSHDSVAMIIPGYQNHRCGPVGQKVVGCFINCHCELGWGKDRSDSWNREIIFMKQPLLSDRKENGSVGLKAPSVCPSLPLGLVTNDNMLSSLTVYTKCMFWRKIKSVTYFKSMVICLLLSHVNDDELRIWGASLKPSTDDVLGHTELNLIYSEKYLK